MYQYDDATVVASLPVPAASGTAGYFTDGAPGTQQATILRADFMNMLMLELLNVVTAGGQAPSKTIYNQLLTALRSAGVFQTPALFDNSSKAATTAFVQRALGNFSTINALTAATTLDATYVGSCILLQGASQYTTTLFSGVTVPRGSAITVANFSSAPQVVTGSAASTLVVNGGAGITSITIQPGESVTIVASGWANMWYVYGTGDLQYSSSFGYSLATPGWQKLPSGLIIQRGSGTPNASGNLQGTLPIAFPTSQLQALLSTSGESTPALVTSVYSLTTTTYDFRVRTLAGAASTQPLSWIAFGY